MKKILFLIHDLGQGGAEKVLVNLVNNMDGSKFDITVIGKMETQLQQMILFTLGQDYLKMVANIHQCLDQMVLTS